MIGLIPPVSIARPAAQGMYIPVPVSKGKASYDVNVGGIDPNTGKWTGNPNLPGYGSGGGGGSPDTATAEQIAVRQREAQLLAEQARQQAEAKRIADLKASQEAQAQAELQQRIIATKQAAIETKTLTTTQGDIVNYFIQKDKSYLQEIQNKTTGNVTYREFKPSEAGAGYGTTGARTITSEAVATGVITPRVQALPQDGSLIPSNLTQLNYSLGIETAREQFKTTRGVSIADVKRYEGMGYSTKDATYLAERQANIPMSIFFKGETAQAIIQEGKARDFSEKSASIFGQTFENKRLELIGTPTGRFVETVNAPFVSIIKGGYKELTTPFYKNIGFQVYDQKRINNELMDPDKRMFNQAVAVTALSLTPAAPLVIGYFGYQGGKSIYKGVTAIQAGKFTPELAGETALGTLMVLPLLSGVKFDVKLPKSSYYSFEEAPQFMSFGKEIPATFHPGEAGKFSVSYTPPPIIAAAYALTVEKITGKLKSVKTTAIGEQIITGAEGTSGIFDIGLIPERGADLKFNAKLLTGEEVVPKKNPTISIENEFQKNVLSVVKEKGDVIGGSFAGKILFKGARKPGDIDIVSYNPLETAKILQARYGYKIKPHEVKGIPIVKVEDLLGNKADIVSIKGYKSIRGLWGYGKLKTVKVEGYNLIRPEDLLYKKVGTLQERGLKYEKAPQTIQDIKTYTGGKLNIDLGKATFSGAYGFTPAELNAYMGKTGTVAHSSTGLFSLFKGKVELQKPEQGGGFDVLFGTPFDIKTGMAQTRVTRLGMDAGIKDILTGNFQTVDKSLGKPQIILFEKQKIGSKVNPKYGKSFSVLQKSSELEVGLPVFESAGKLNVIQKVKGAGSILINGKRVSIIIARVGEAKKILTPQTLDLLKTNKLSSKQTQQLKQNLYKETGVAYSSTAKPYLNLNKLFPRNMNVQQQSISKLSPVIFETSSFSRSFMNKPSSQVSYNPSLVSSIMRSSISPSSSVGSISTPGYSTSTTSKSTSSVSSSLRRLSRSSVLPRPSKSTSRYSYSYPKTPPPEYPRQTRYQPYNPKLKLSTPSYGVSIRRFGKWKLYAKSTSLRGAFSLGKKYTLGSLGASFKVEGVGRIPYAPKGYYAKQEKGQQIFIQKRAGRLSSIGEKLEIKSYARSKRKKRKGDLF